MKKTQTAIIIMIVVIIGLFCACAFLLIGPKFPKEKANNPVKEEKVSQADSKLLFTENFLEPEETEEKMTEKKMTESVMETESEKEKEKRQAVSVELEMKDATHTGDDGVTVYEEYGILTGKSEDGSVVWNDTTDMLTKTELPSCTEIGIHQDVYYMVAQGTVLAFRLADGKELWRVEGGGSPADNGYDFDEDGTLYLCGFYGPDFLAIDKDGKILKRIERLDEEYYRPYQLKCKGDQVFVTFEETASDGTDVVIGIDTQDYHWYKDALSEKTLSEEASPEAEQTQEEKIQHIRDVYYGIQEHLDDYEVFESGNGMTYYMKNDELCKIFVPAGTYSTEECPNADVYSAEYYYENNLLKFVFIFAGTEEYRYYFHQDKTMECIRYIDENGKIYDAQEGVDLWQINSKTAGFCMNAYMEPHWAGLI